MTGSTGQRMGKRVFPVVARGSSGSSSIGVRFASCRQFGAAQLPIVNCLLAPVSLLASVAVGAYFRKAVAEAGSHSQTGIDHHESTARAGAMDRRVRHPADDSGPVSA